MSFISSPTITADKIERFIQILKPRQEAGVKVSVILTKPENRCYGNTDFYLILIEKMKETGIQVIMVDEDTECFAIIDQELVWHGGMNLLGKVDAWDNLIRIKSESIVQELMGMILKEFCDNDVTSSGHSVQHKVSLKYKKPDPPDQYRQSSGGSFYYISESVGPLSLHFSGSARGRNRCSDRYRLLWTPELQGRFWSGWHSAGYS